MDALRQRSRRRRLRRAHPREWCPVAPLGEFAAAGAGTAVPGGRHRGGLRRRRPDGRTGGVARRRRHTALARRSVGRRSRARGGAGSCGATTSRSCRRCRGRGPPSIGSSRPRSAARARHRYPPATRSPRHGSSTPPARARRRGAPSPISEAPTLTPQGRGRDSPTAGGASAPTIQASHVARTLLMSFVSDSVNRRAATPRIMPKSTTASGRRVEVAPDRPVLLATSDQIGPPVVAPLLRLQHAVDGRLRRERRAPHHDERTLLGGRVLEQLQIGGEGGADQLERGEVLGGSVRHAPARSASRPARGPATGGRAAPRARPSTRSGASAGRGSSPPIRRSWPGTSARRRARRSTRRRRRAAPARTCCAARPAFAFSLVVRPGLASHGEGTRTDVTCWSLSK